MNSRRAADPEVFLVALGRRGGQNAGMSEPDDCDDPSLARGSGASRPEDRDEMMRKTRRKFWECFWVGLPIGLVLCYYLFAAGR